MSDLWCSQCVSRVLQRRSTDAEFLQSLLWSYRHANRAKTDGGDIILKAVTISNGYARCVPCSG